MGGFFGAVSRKNCKYDVFFGTDYHSHLGTKRGGVAFWGEEKGFQRQIHNIESTPFRTKFEGDLAKMNGTAGIGAISDGFPQEYVFGQAAVGDCPRTGIGAGGNNATHIMEQLNIFHRPVKD